MRPRAENYAPSFNQAVGTVEPYRGTDHTVAKMIELVRGDRGERSIKVRRHTEQIVNRVRPKAYESEIIAICRWWGNAGRYTRDPLHVEIARRRIEAARNRQIVVQDGKVKASDANPAQIGLFDL